MNTGTSFKCVVCLFVLMIVAGCSATPCYRPEYFAPPVGASYIAEEVRIKAPAGHTLAGTLTLPTDASPPFPGVVLITGSSPQNRDMTAHWVWPASAYKPFRQIAHTLSQHGIAVLRTDDRGCGCSGGGPLKNATIQDRADDNRSAVAYLKGRAEIDPARIGLLGLSEGGIIGPMIAASDDSIRAVVILAGTATNGWKIMEHQYWYDIERNEKLSSQEKKDALEKRMAKLRKWVRSGKATPWSMSFMAYMPLPTAQKVTCPVLILHGDKDAQVPVEHAHYLAQAMKSAGNTDVTVRIFKDIDHPFLPDTDGRQSGYMKLLRNGAVVPEEVIDTITTWLVDHLLAGRVTTNEAATKDSRTADAGPGIIR